MPRASVSLSNWARVTSVLQSASLVRAAFGAAAAFPLFWGLAWSGFEAEVGDVGAIVPSTRSARSQKPLIEMTTSSSATPVAVGLGAHL